MKACSRAYWSMLAPVAESFVGSWQEYLAMSLAADDGTAISAALLADARCADRSHRST
jgi:hypothetical protein